MKVHQSCYPIVTDLLFIIVTLAQVGAHPHKDGEHNKKVFGRPTPWPPPYEASKGVQPKLEAQSNSTSSLFRTPGTARTKMDATVTYGLRFGHTLYGWKDNSNTLLMALVSGPNSFGVDRNPQNKMTSRICLGVASPFFGLWAMYRVEPIRGATKGGLARPKPFISCSH